MKRLLVSTAVISGLLSYVPVSNAALVLTGGSSVGLPISGNDFNTQLQGLGYNDMTNNSQLSVDQAGFVTFTYIGSESGFTNSFNTPSGSMTEIATNDPWNLSGYDSITISVLAGDILNFNFTSSGGAGALTPVDNFTGANLQGLGIFTAGSSLQQVILGYDDQAPSVDDDNHDDMMIRVDFSPVPVPAAAWLFGSGLIGLVGVVRRKKKA